MPEGESKCLKCKINTAEIPVREGKLCPTCATKFYLSKAKQPFSQIKKYIFNGHFPGPDVDRVLVVIKDGDNSRMLLDTLSILQKANRRGSETLCPSFVLALMGV